MSCYLLRGIAFRDQRNDAITDRRIFDVRQGLAECMSESQNGAHMPHRSDRARISGPNLSGSSGSCSRKKSRFFLTCEGRSAMLRPPPNLAFLPDGILARIPFLPRRLRTHKLLGRASGRISLPQRIRRCIASSYPPISIRLRWGP